MQDAVRFDGDTGAVLLSFLTISLLVSNVTLINILNKDAESNDTNGAKRPRTLTWMSIIFTTAYGLRTVFQVFYGLWYNLVDDEGDEVN